MIDWSIYPNFARAEFTCSHTGRCDMQPEYLARLQAMRIDYGRPMRVTSGYRHPTHPVEAGKRSQTAGEHTLGAAADIACTSGRDRYDLVRLALQHGFTRIGIAKGFVHLGIGGPGLPMPVIWEYGS